MRKLEKIVRPQKNRNDITHSPEIRLALSFEYDFNVLFSFLHLKWNDDLRNKQIKAVKNVCIIYIDSEVS